jgi:hypothetical protein
MSIFGSITLDGLFFFLICVGLILIGFTIGWLLKGKTKTVQIPQEKLIPPVTIYDDVEIIESEEVDDQKKYWLKTCKVCGKPIKKNQQFCVKCGTDVVIKGHYPHNLF